jgi:hypothetical protein
MALDQRREQPRIHPMKVSQHIKDAEARLHAQLQSGFTKLEIEIHEQRFLT